MKKGFFSPEAFTTKTRIPTIPRCGKCGLYKTCHSPKMPVTGKGRKKILIIAEAPGEKEDLQGVQLIGQSGQFLRRSLRHIGISLDQDCWKTNAVLCKPPDNEGPNNLQIEACRPNLKKTIDDLKPNVIIPLGGIATNAVLSLTWKDSDQSITKWAGWQIPCTEPNVWIMPTYHPAFMLRAQDDLLLKMFETHLKAAKKKSKPWKKAPNYKSQIEIIMDPRQAAKRIKQYIKDGGTIAFDYETNMLKPDYKEAEIVSCSICWKGKETIAYPWQAEAVTATKAIIKANNPKIASNLKFETRWTKAILKCSVQNWFWDTMIAAHVLDNRSGITSIKFQSFVLIGAPVYDSHISPYLKSEKGSQKNRIHELDPKDLLLYNGLDSLLEYKVAVKQIKMLKERNK